MFHQSLNNATTDLAHGDPAAGVRVQTDNARTIDGQLWNSFMSERQTGDNSQNVDLGDQIEEQSNENSDFGPLNNNPLPGSKTKQNSQSTKHAKIFDLCWEDRKRVGELIAELALVQDKLSDTEQRCKVALKQEENYKQKCSNLMKKVDVLTEKCQRLEGEKLQMKEKHLESLKTLDSTVASISEKFDQSAEEIQILR